MTGVSRDDCGDMTPIDLLGASDLFDAKYRAEE